MFLEKISLKIFLKKKVGKKKKENPPCPSQEQLLGRRRKKEKTQPLHLETTKPLPSPMSIKKQPLIEKVPALEKKHLSIPFLKVQEKKSLWNGWGISTLFPSPPISKSPFEKEKKRKLPTPLLFS
jgi:hypothetical protein